MGSEIDLEAATMIASHYAAARDQPAALRATVQAALAAREVHAPWRDRGPGRAGTGAVAARG